MPSACSNKKNNKKANNKGSSNGKKTPVTDQNSTVPVVEPAITPETAECPVQSKACDTSSNEVNNQSAQISKAAAAGFTEEDVDDELPLVKAQPVPKDDNSSNDAQNDNKTSENDNSEEQFVFNHDPSFNVKIIVPGLEPFEIEVSPMEMVQEIVHQLEDKEETCHRTCFTLQFEGNTLDNFSELKSIEGLKDGSELRVCEEPYNVREARIHVRHVRNLLKSVDITEAYNGTDCKSLSFMNVIAQNDIFEQKSKTSKNFGLDCLPPEYVLPNSEFASSLDNNNTKPSTNGLTNPSGNSTETVNESLNSPVNSGNCNISLIPLHPQPKEQNKSQNALKMLSQSAWNPPPGYRKLRGDLMYLYVVTFEDKRIHITSCTRGFFVNQSTDDVFNPKPVNHKQIYHSLVDLLISVSPIFKRNYSLIQKRRHQYHPFERLATPYQVYSWTAPQIEHSPDSVRAEDAFSAKVGYEEHMPGQTRDWNEELQTTRDLPRKLCNERIIRERAIFKVHSDFISAATRGAQAIIDGNVMALNPGEESKMQMFIWNNIFFSLGFDVRDHYKDLGGDAAAFAAPINDLQGVKAYSALDIEGLYTLATAVIDYRGYRVTAQSIIPGILEREQEQSVSYGSIDFGKTVTSDEKYFEILNKAGKYLRILPHKVVNEDGTEVEICSSVECKGIVGNDGRHYILDLLRTFPADPNFLVIEGEELSPFMKSLGFPHEHKHKLCSLRQELIEAFFENRYMLFIKLAAIYLQQSDLKKNVESNIIKDSADNSAKAIEDNKDEKKDVPEEVKKLVESIASPNKTKKDKNDDNTDEKNAKEGKDAVEDEVKNEQGLTVTQIESAKEIIRKTCKDIGSLKDDEFDMRFNPDIFSPGVTHPNTDSEDFKKQKQLIKDAAEFLMKVQIPSLIREALELSIYLYDGLTLTEAMHSRGINMRYLGKVAEHVAKYSTLDYLMNIVVCEIVCRSAKHLFPTYIQNVDATYQSSAIVHFLNCLLSNTVFQPNVQSEEMKAKRKNNKRSKNKSGNGSPDHKNTTEWISLTPKSLWSQIKSEMEAHYIFTVDDSIDSFDVLFEKYSIRKMAFLRLFCIRTGVQLVLRDYNFEHKNKCAFYEDDILNIFPIVKHISPRANDAHTCLQTGQRKIQEGNLREGYDYISEALNLFNNVYGPLHSDIVQCLRLLGRINYLLSEYEEACLFQQKAALMSERVNGIDHPHTITEYNYLGLYSFANQQLSASLKFFYRARYLLALIHGEKHPEMATIDSNIGLILHAIGEYESAFIFLDHALKLNIHYFGRRNLKVALSYHLVARALSYMGDFRGALNNEKETFMIYKQELGQDHEKTKESSDCLRHLTNQAVVLQKKMNEICKGNTNAIFPPLQISPPSLTSILEMLNVINGILFVHLDMDNIKELQAAAVAACEQKKQDNEAQLSIESVDNEPTPVTA